MRFFYICNKYKVAEKVNGKRPFKGARKLLLFKDFSAA
jgi:hypothetical protein